MTFDATTELRYMAAAERLARRGLGKVWPNPPVACLIVRKNEAGQPVIAGRGVTSPPGSANGSHAEVNALRAAGDQAMGATCFVTLEPCSHYGRTPPCSLALINAGVERVVIGMRDPNPRVSGRGVQMLQDAGIDVAVGVHQAACEALYHGFTSRITMQKPHVFLKLAVSRDGYIGKKGAGQVKISSDLSMRHVHGFRATHDAILIGIGTALADDPQLTCRLPGMAKRSPVRVVLDREARLPLNSKLARTSPEVPVWLICGNDADPDRVQALSACGVLVIRVPANNGHIEIETALRALATRGITRVMVEGGARVARAFLEAGAVDDLCVVTGNIELGEGSVPALAGMELDAVLSDPTFARIDAGCLGDDRYLYLRRRGD
ncbi:diaminohydroxyphosphoribosylaminopyrimidine deaminase/5-amino-6-(5-phosphoribosylamino)uracil reductase [Roseibium hamelinense]|uniref:Riboflavin biosynthesis protein RibD n=1 Tax=Roseibium hamelinense TaxID=150831 RepID=A0A562TH00_9HYPH|nr:bifunctional diaminohydroxyphosphoribosylaminopyrimidine deaminase/5-amino-6-(5-phosphoribosylamino)uracil reductase RibD [Roseibium hamelinense]MTI46195.1 bifunctional diaminohydroxyphosphoribosylaminopyrimidine deaminase/5-amino-6-(5-phosphoribosylamino)uracil reductase RibD [Roseibium hamelinense]TWI92613.1 diaminohydroxyphosphoribosylaminopyrimidine deaminase/5-amino-6-(5-phosphoribosylamino)uracil reductase [Roseibium hamelinense]